VLVKLDTLLDGSGVLDEQVVLVEGSAVSASWTVVTSSTVVALLCLLEIIWRRGRG
jgi:hypothetical protein